MSACTTGRLVESFASNSEGRIKCVPLNNRPCQARPTLVDITLMKLFYQFFVSVNKYDRLCNTIAVPYPPVCVLDKVTNMNVKVFN